MLEVANSGENHGHRMRVAVVDAQDVFYRSTRLNNSGYACQMRQFHTVWEGEKRIGSQNCSV